MATMWSARDKPRVGTPLDMSHPLSMGCRMAYLLGENYDVGALPYGKIQDSSPYKRNGIITGAFSSSPWVSTRVGSGLLFPNASSSVNTSSTENEGNGNFPEFATLDTGYSVSFAGWINIASVTLGNSVVNYRNGFAGGWVFGTWASNGGKPFFYGDGAGTINGSTVIPTNEDVFLSCNFIDRTVEFFINGISDGGGTFTGALLASGYLGLGSWDAGGFGAFNGVMQGVRGWDRALSPEEHMWLYQEPWAGFEQWGHKKYYFMTSNAITPAGGARSQIVMIS